MTATERGGLIARYSALPGLLDTLLSGLLAGPAGDALDASSAPGEWSAREIIHHLGDSELMDAARLRLIAAEEDPEITPYDEGLFAARLGSERPVGPSLAAVRAARESGTDILAGLGADDFERSGRHPEHDEYTLAIWLEKAVEHGELHLAQLRRALERA